MLQIFAQNWWTKREYRAVYGDADAVTQPPTVPATVIRNHLFSEKLWKISTNPRHSLRFSTRCIRSWRHRHALHPFTAPPQPPTSGTDCQEAAAIRAPAAHKGACPTRRVRLVREGGGRGGCSRRSAPAPSRAIPPFTFHHGKPRPVPIPSGRFRPGDHVTPPQNGRERGPPPVRAAGQAACPISTG